MRFVLEPPPRRVPGPAPSLVVQPLASITSVGKDIFARPGLRGCDSADTYF